MKNIKTILAILYISLLIYASQFSFANFSNISSVGTYETKGVTLATAMGIALIISVFSDNKKIFYVASVGAIISQLYTFFVVYKLYSDKMNLEKGFYLYVVAFLILIINIFIKFDTIEKKRMTDEISSVGKMQKDMYIYAKYLYGINSNVDLKNSACALICDNDNRNMTLYVSKNQQTYKYQFSYDNLKKVSLNRRYLSDVVTQDDYSAEYAAIGTLLVSPLAGTLANILSSANNYNSVKCKELFIIEFEYCINGYVGKMMVETKTSPDVFLNNFNWLNNVN